MVAERTQGESQPLHRPVAEASVIGGVLGDARSLERVEGLVSAHDFYAERNRILFELFQELWAAGAAIDVPTVIHELELRGDLAHAGGAEYLLELDLWTANSANIEQHARIVREMSQRRQLAAIGRDVAALARTNTPIEEVVDTSERLIYAVASRSNADTLERITGDQILATLERKAEGDLGVMSGFRDLDRLTLGFMPGELWVVAGGTSMGKTAFALQIAQHVAATAGPVGVFTLEMMREELIWRMLCATAGVDGQEFRRRRGETSQHDYAELSAAAAHLNQLPIYLDESSTVNVNHVRAASRRLASRGGLSMIVVDHLQIMDGGAEENRQLQLATITRGLKALAKDLRVPVLVLSQLSRFKDRADKRPQLSDLRESGAIEQDANGVIMLFRPEYYYGEVDRDGNSLKGKAEAIVGKNRNGATGTVHLYFRETFARFEDRTPRMG